MSDELRDALVRHGRARTRARQKAKAESDAISVIARQALEAGISKSEIARLAGLTRPGLEEILKS